MRTAKGDLLWFVDVKFAIALVGLTSIFALTGPAQNSVQVQHDDVGKAEFNEKAQLPRVLLLGDSISSGYSQPVRTLLEGKAKANVEARGGSSTVTALEKLDEWLGGTTWDVINFNWALNDLEGKRVPPAQYEKNLREIVRRLKATGAKLIWCTTTPVPQGKLTSDRDYRDVPIYNEVAKKIMDENGIAITDLYGFALPRLAEIQQKEDVHFTEKGYELLGGQVAQGILDVLARKDEPLSIGLRKQLLVDDYVVSKMVNVTRELGQATKANDGKPIIVADKPWEDPDVFRLGSVFRDGNKFRMYCLISGDLMGYMESEDGLHWTKPSLGFYEYQGSKDNNIVDSRSLTCYLDPHETDPAHKYKTVYSSEKSMACLAHSPDGFIWTPYNNGQPVTGRASDTINQILWDEDAGVYRLYTRTDYGRGLYGGSLDEDRGTRDMTNPDVKANPTNWKTIREWHFDREGRWEFKRRQVHHLNVTLYEGVYLALLNAYEWPDAMGEGPYDLEKRHERDIMNCYIVTSRGNEMWDLSWVYKEKPLIPRGPSGSFDKDMVWSGPNIVTWNDKHWIYYVGFRERFAIYRTRGEGETRWRNAIGLATLRLDGFVCLEAKDEPGTVVTKPFQLEGGKLEVNVDAKKGEVVVEALDEGGQPVPGFTRMDAQVFRGVDELRLQPRWSGGADLAALKGKVVRLKFHLANARLYAFQVKV